MTVTVNGVDSTGTVDAAGHFSINVAGSDLAGYNCQCQCGNDRCRW
ncbi:hypothetical protein [Sulfurimonas sp. HSL3-7]